MHVSFVFILKMRPRVNSQIAIVRNFAISSRGTIIQLELAQKP